MEQLGIIKYLHWKTKEEQEYILGNHGWDNEKITNRMCPFDNTSLIFGSDKFNHSLFCPNCRAEYTRDSTQGEINEQAKKHAQKNKNELIKIEEKRNTLKAIIQHSEEVGLFKE
ncbi:Uncharacterised protein [uncultured archaeon]|nr:Uncharacterised protein [uncultured archaeon]